MSLLRKHIFCGFESCFLESGISKMGTHEQPSGSLNPAKTHFLLTRKSKENTAICQMSLKRMSR